MSTSYLPAETRYSGASYRRSRSACGSTATTSSWSAPVLTEGCPTLTWPITMARGQYPAEDLKPYRDELVIST